MTGALAWGIMDTMDTMDIMGMEVGDSLALVEATEEAAEDSEVVVVMAAVAVVVEVAAK
jgi:hypothetical protein